MLETLNMNLHLSVTDKNSIMSRAHKSNLQVKVEVLGW